MRLRFTLFSTCLHTVRHPPVSGAAFEECQLACRQCQGIAHAASDSALRSPWDLEHEGASTPSVCVALSM